jgi:hypothetical protein
MIVALDFPAIASSLHVRAMPCKSSISSSYTLASAIRSSPPPKCAGISYTPRGYVETLLEGRGKAKTKTLSPSSSPFAFRIWVTSARGRRLEARLGPPIKSGEGITSGGGSQFTFFAALAREIRSPPPRDPPRQTRASPRRIAIPIRGNRRPVAGRHRRPGLIADGGTEKVHFSF